MVFLTFQAERHASPISTKVAHCLGHWNVYVLYTAFCTCKCFVTFVIGWCLVLEKFHCYPAECDMQHYRSLNIFFFFFVHVISFLECIFASFESIFPLSTAWCGHVQQHSAKRNGTVLAVCTALGGSLCDDSCPVVISFVTVLPQLCGLWKLRTKPARQ